LGGLPEVQVNPAQQTKKGKWALTPELNELRKKA
jgi:hypothetical protein